MASPSLHKRLQTTLIEKMIPAARAGAPLELLESPLRGVAGNVISRPAPPLPLTRVEPSHLHLRLWPEEGLNAVRAPFLGFIIEGEADIKTGVTTTMARRAPRSLEECGRQVLSIRQNAFFIVPPGVPVSFGPRPHWERENPERAHSRIFWINVLPSGALCHTCVSDGGEHVTHPFLFVKETQLTLTAELLLRELQRPPASRAAASRQADIAIAQLLILLLQIERAFAAQEPLLLDTAQQVEHVASLPGLRPSTPAAVEEKLPGVLSTETAVQRACSYIQANLNNALTPADVAAHVYVSIAHLNRLFHAECGLPVMQYITRYRHDYAKSLLTQSALPVADVGRLVGYVYPSHFSQVFSRLEGVSPQEFRRRRSRQACIEPQKELCANS